MHSTIQYGRFIINLQWLILAASCVFGYSILSMRIKAMKPHNKVVQEAVVDSLLITVAVWKLSLILFEPVVFLNNPQTLIYFSGGNRGFLLGIFGAFANLLYSSRKRKISIWIYVDSIAAGFLAGSIFYYLALLVLSRQLVMFYASQSLLALILLIWQIKNFKVIGNIQNLNQLLMWFSFGKLLDFHFKASNVNYNSLILGFTLQQVLFYVLAIFSVALHFKLIRRG